MRYTSSIGTLALVATFSSGPVLAQDSGNITVEAPRSVGPKERSALGAPIENVTLVGRVSFRDLDLRSPAGVKALDERVLAFARGSCQQLENMYPVGSPEWHACMKVAIDGATPQVQAAIAAATKGPTTAQ